PVLPSPFEKYGVGTEQNTFSTGLTANYLYDNRKNSINPDQGTYAAMTIRFNPAWLGNEDLWTSVYLDGRHYFPLDLKKRKVLALWAFYWGSFGNVPYFNLPGTALEFNARSGRGFPQARFRGKHMLYFESEYRFDITRNGLLGATLFANFQSLTEPVTNTFAYINPAVGFGARIKFNKESNTNLTIDFGFGKNYTGVYIGLGEFF
ncbi:MAG: BamA/TamA family outer membrane protein, partial [Cyclobacteriaceae bacterium]|nr:BamA/TamA family outer membrane protein [Cyclobacteriaceae bacterium]